MFMIVFELIRKLENRAKLVIFTKILAHKIYPLKILLTKLNFYKTGQANNIAYLEKILPRYLFWFQKNQKAEGKGVGDKHSYF